MDNYDHLNEKILKEYILGVLYILTGLYLCSFACFYFIRDLLEIRHFLFIFCFFNTLSIIAVQVVPTIYIKQLVKPFLVIMLLLFCSLASYSLCMGGIDTALWFIVIPLFIYAVFPDIKIISLLIWMGCLMILTFGMGFALRYYWYDNKPVTFPSLYLIDMVWIEMLNTFIAFLFVIHSLYYISRSHQQKINYLEHLSSNNEEKIQSLLEINCNDQHKFDEIYKKIVDYFEDTQPYLNSDFRIGKISNDLNTNSLYISKAIFIGKNMNFNDFVNMYRVAHAKKLIEENLQYTLEYVYLSSGFKCQSSFNRAFKILEEVTPSDYRKHLDDIQFDQLSN